MKQRRGIRKLLVRACVFLLLGAIVNIAVAWGCARWAPFGPLEFHPIDDSDAKWLCDHGWNCDGMTAARGTGVDWYRFDGIPDYGNEMRFIGTTSIVGARLETDLPLRALMLQSVMSRREGRQAEEPWIMSLSSWPTGEAFAPTSARIMPMKPIAMSFVLNTLFYAAIVWMLFAAPFTMCRMRRMRRIKRGLCPVCAYPFALGTSDLCTECGRPVPRLP